MDHLFFTDPHLGLSRTTNTTAQSQKRLQEALFDQAMSIVNDGKEKGYRIHCLGDLFDRFSNPEPIIAQGMELARECDTVIGGNHDARNRTDAVSSLDLLARALNTKDDQRVVYAPFGERAVKIDQYDGFVLCSVAHVGGQQLFDEVLAYAVEGVKPLTHQKYKILMLHCNYDRDFGHDIENDPALNLSTDKAKELLEVFDYILLGHEHEPLEDLDGRVKILGNTMPLGFGEISDRYCYTFADGVFEARLIWSVAEHYREFTVQDILDRAAVDDLEMDSTSVTMVQIGGTIAAADYPEFSKALVKLWRQNESLLMVRTQVEVDRPADKQASLPSFVRASIPQMVAADLEGTELASQYKELVQEVDADDSRE